MCLSRMPKMEWLDSLLKVSDHSDQYGQDKAWHGVVESRLLALEDNCQRRHAFKMFLKFLNLSVYRLSHILLPSGNKDFPDIQNGSKSSIYQIHQLRMSLRDNFSGIPGNTQSSQKTFEEKCGRFSNSIHFCLGNIICTLNLVDWLMKSLWSETFFVRNLTEGYGSQSQDLRSAKLDRSDPWVPILQTLLQLLQEVKSLLENYLGKDSVESASSTRLCENGHGSGTLESDHWNELLDIGHIEESLVDGDPVVGLLNSDSVKGKSKLTDENMERSVQDSDSLHVFSTGSDLTECKLESVPEEVFMDGCPSVIPLKDQVMKTIKGITNVLQCLLGPKGEVEREVWYKMGSTDDGASSEVQNYEAKTFEQLTKHVDERLEHYEDVFWEILTTKTHQQNSRWLAFLQGNTDLLLNRRSLHFLLELPSQEEYPSGVFPVSAILKLCLKCVRDLPLPIFNDIHKWLWSSPKRCQILLDAIAEEYDIELNETFNKLTRCDTSKLAVQVGCLLLQRPRATLRRAVQDISQNQEAVKTLCEVFQSLPAVEDFCLPGQNVTVMFETLSTALHEKKWKKQEENNLLNFVVKICQHFQSPEDPEFSFQYPPIVPCDLLLKQLILPSFTTELDSEELASKNREGSKQIPLERSLRLLAKFFNSCSQFIRNEVLSPLLLCLCELLETFSRTENDLMNMHERKGDIIIKELILQNLELVCGELEGIGRDDMLCKDKNFQQDLLLLWENLDPFHWTTKLRVSFNLASVATYFRQYCSKFMDSLPVMIGSCGNASKEEELILWVSILHASSISEKLAERCCEVCSKVVSQSGNSFSLSHQSLVVSLAHCLPSCTESEWSNVASFVRGLVSDVLDVPYYSEFTSYLPVSLHDTSAALSFSQMMLSVLEVSFQTCCGTDSHQHIIKCYVVAMQNLLLIFQNDCHDNQSTLFLAGQIFCQACFAMTFVPFECQETLIVLTLEVLGHVEAACRSKVRQWHLIQGDMLRAVDWCSSPGDQDALMKKIQELG
ncbi:Gem-associated protein 4 [Holothuria leucospilota]|uniref:Gem-associated protein 4 n=1 Tax=Holothuria leucospilota TaxID=206669 RepID=A0A9Q1HBY5_HOLLE|nr:Gem-associated protein 4 [Holothuria leucospilota]